MTDKHRSEAWVPFFRTSCGHGFARPANSMNRIFSIGCVHPTASAQAKNALLFRAGAAAAQCKLQDTAPEGNRKCQDRTVLPLTHHTCLCNFGNWVQHIARKRGFRPCVFFAFVSKPSTRLGSHVCSMLVDMLVSGMKRANSREVRVLCVLSHVSHVYPFTRPTFMFHVSSFFPRSFALCIDFPVMSTSGVADA